MKWLKFGCKFPSKWLSFQSQSTGQSPCCGRNANIRAQGVERAAGQIDDALDPEDKLQSGGQKEKGGSMEYAGHQNIDR